MGKNIVLCSDGTGNQDIKNRGTNVFKLYEAVDIQGHKDCAVKKQVAFYDDGVGTANAFARVVGGAFGWGFSSNVKSLYRELVNVYEYGDSIYLFGFSRGAYTVRALAGMIQYCGVLDINNYYGNGDRHSLTKKIDECWSDFRGEAFRSAPDAERRGFVPSREEEGSRREATIKRREKYGAVNPLDLVDIPFIGVWDTVGAIGVPFDELRRVISWFYPIWFADNTLGPEVKRACQALSIDDERRTFHPELWNEQDGCDTRLLQVWFAGVHSNVGGGYPKQGMSLVTLDWMMKEADNAGLRFNREDINFVHERQDVHDKIYDSRSGLAVYYRWAPRDISWLSREHRIARPKIHVSVFERIANGTEAYAPGNIPFEFDLDATGSFNSWPASTVPTSIPLLVNAVKHGKEGSLLVEMSGAVASGKKSYYAFIALTVLTLTSLAMRAGFCYWSRFIWTASIFAVCGGLIYIWAMKVDGALEKRYTEFWHDCRGSLRNIL
jgi:uncharacterized protein (DUF2235 family)